jgi:Protein of unknown function (DUF3500)
LASSYTILEMSSDEHLLAAVMAEAASTFLACLDRDQRRAAAWPFPADGERRLWFYTPTDHGGVTLEDLRPAQQRLAFELVATGLSRPGYVAVSTIMGLENVLDLLDGWNTFFNRPRGRDPGLYYLRIFGEPSADGTWSWRFGGHHVSINHTVIDGRVASSTPCFLGAHPASSPLLGPHLLRPLAGAEDLGLDLARSLDEGQRAAAVISPAPALDIVGANRPRILPGDLPLPLVDVWRGHFSGELEKHLREVQADAERKAGLRPEDLEALRLSAAPKGIAADQLDPGQQELLRALLDVYIDRIPDSLADQEAAKYRGERLAEFGFAWAGSVEPGEAHYYRVQGPRLLVEYDNAQCDPNHIHTVWRDPDGDFGEDVLATHLRLAH